jgi:Protein of unknown function (DUF3987)
MHNVLSLPPFPGYALPGLAGEIVRDLSMSSVCPSIIGGTFCAVVSLLTQGIADVTWPNGQEVAVGANVLLVAPSAAGKSFVYKILMKAVEERLEVLALDEANSAMSFLVEDTTKEALLQTLNEWPVAAVMTDEAGSLKRLLPDSATLAKLLDGTAIRNSRVSTGRMKLSGHRFTMLLMEQPKVFDAHKVLLGASNGSVGVVNRFMLMATDRMPAIPSLNRPGLFDSVSPPYGKRVGQLLQQAIAFVKSGQTKRPRVALAPAANQFLLHVSDEMQQLKLHSPNAARISEYLARHAERVLRLAGALHVFEHGSDGQVQLDTMQAADLVGRWSLEAFDQMTFVPPVMSQAELDAQLLEQALVFVAQQTGRYQFPIADVRMGLFNKGVSKQRFNRALPILTGQNKAWVVKENRVDWVKLHVPTFSQTFQTQIGRQLT